MAEGQKPLTLWNTLNRRLEEFKSIKPGKVGLYTCGPTVYNPVTLGNWRAFLFDDVLARTLRSFVYEVKWVMNVTDVGHLVGDGDEGEDKIEREAAKRGVDAWELARGLEAEFLKGMERLNIRKPDEMPRATDHIQEQIDLVKELEMKGFTYQTSDGIYFDTSKFPSYGRLSGQKLEEKEAGARVTVNLEKRNAPDFALWKFSPKDKKRQMEWESPWGVGFPGWHIECSAMSVEYLGQPFDIHAGGVDHIPVHHENEIAQSGAATGKALAKFWLHNEFLLVDGRRMGKSEGNAYTLEDVIAHGFDPLAFRYLCLGTHYRQKLNFTWEALEGAQNALRNLQSAIRRLKSPLNLRGGKGELFGKFQEALGDDLNTPKALAVIWDVVRGGSSDDEKAAALLKMDEVLGLGLESVVSQSSEIPGEVLQLAEERSAARANKDWAKADELREQIEKLGWRVEDKNRGEFELTPL